MRTPDIPEDLASPTQATPSPDQAVTDPAVTDPAVTDQVAGPLTPDQLAFLNEKKTQAANLLAEVASQLDAAKAASRDYFAGSVREMIASAGFTLEEIVAILVPAQGKGKGKGKKATTDTRRPGNYPTYVDPNNAENTYRRGVLPAWFKEKMVALSLDPTNKADREKFKLEHLVTQ